jgi:hypothetical protein
MDSDGIFSTLQTEYVVCAKHALQVSQRTWPLLHCHIRCGGTII